MSTTSTNHIVPDSADHAMVRRHYEALLAEARAALGPEFCGTPNSLAGRIDDALQPLPAQPDPALVLTALPSGEFAWLRP